MNKQVVLLTIVCALTGCAGNGSYTKYRGHQQTWPTGSAAAASTENIPVFYGLPPTAYRVVGTYHLPSSSIAPADAAQLARHAGGEAVLVVEQDSELASALRTTGVTLRPTSHPLNYKDSNIGFAVEEKTELPQNRSSMSSDPLAVVIRWNR